MSFLRLLGFSLYISLVHNTIECPKIFSWHHLLADSGPQDSLISFGIRECFSEIKGWKPLSVPYIFLCWGTGSGKSLLDRASFAGRFSWTMSPWHRLTPFWACWCSSTHKNIQDYVVCSQWLCVAIVNHVLSKASVIS